MRALIESVLKNKELIITSLIALILGGPPLFMKLAAGRRSSRARLMKEKEKRNVFLAVILKEIRDERTHFKRIKNGESLRLTGLKRKALVEFPFEDIKREVQKLAKERRYRTLCSRILLAVDNRNVVDPRESITELERLLDGLENKIETEGAGELSRAAKA